MQIATTFHKDRNTTFLFQNRKVTRLWIRCPTYDSVAPEAIYTTPGNTRSIVVSYANNMCVSHYFLLQPARLACGHVTKRLSNLFVFRIPYTSTSTCTWPSIPRERERDSPTCSIGSLHSIPYLDPLFPHESVRRGSRVQSSRDHVDPVDRQCSWLFFSPFNVVVGHPHP